MCSLEPGIENHGQTIIDPDKRTLTGLSWLACKEDVKFCATPSCALILIYFQMILVICKPGLISLWTSPTSTLQWSGLRSLILQPQAYKLSVGSSPFQPVSGFHYIPHEDILMMCLFDGSIRVIYDLSSEPSWTPTIANDKLTSHMLSKNARAVFSRTELGKIRRTDVNRITGLIPYDGHATLLWAHECVIAFLW